MLFNCSFENCPNIPVIGQKQAVLLGKMAWQKHGSSPSRSTNHQLASVVAHGAELFATILPVIVQSSRIKSSQVSQTSRVTSVTKSDFL